MTTSSYSRPPLLRGPIAQDLSGPVAINETPARLAQKEGQPLSCLLRLLLVAGDPVFDVAGYILLHVAAFQGTQGFELPAYLFAELDVNYGHFLLHPLYSISHLNGQCQLNKLFESLKLFSLNNLHFHRYPR